MTSSTDSIPNPNQSGYISAAQLRKQQLDDKEKMAQIATMRLLRIKAIELAAQFKSDDPMKLAREIYKFLSDTEV